MNEIAGKPDNTEEISNINEKAYKMMAKMGYKVGNGLGQLGANSWGNQPITSNQEVHVTEDMIWFTRSHQLKTTNLLAWLKKDAPKTDIDLETHFCDVKLLNNIIEAKKIFDELEPHELCKARSKSNPFETIRSAFFMNRAALKMANIDAATNFMFTEVDRNPLHKESRAPYYFADVCAGPGGFSEYILWRKKWAFKGFGFTLKGTHDFKLHDSTCASHVTFHPFYGANEDGDVCNPSNIRDYANKVLFETQVGVHFMMADGGFSVEGMENLQEVLSKQLYVCQCLVALEIVRPNGHFVTKLFDCFTVFTVGLIFLMSQCFDKIAILKPNSSRPANSERYLICSGLKNSSTFREIRNYLRFIVDEFWSIKNADKDEIGLVDIEEIVPLHVIQQHTEFTQYMTATNNALAQQQVVGLLKLAAFCRNPSLLDARQDELRSKCLAHWRIPDKMKMNAHTFGVEDLLSLATNKPEFLYAQPRDILTTTHLSTIIADVTDWKYVPLACSRKTNICNIYVGVNGSKVYRLQKHKWVRVKNIHLIKGTILYGEMVHERVRMRDTHPLITDAVAEVRSLHVIDALRLGDTSMADLSFDERMSLICTYCQAVNFESTQTSIRIRPKLFDNLANICKSDSLLHLEEDHQYITNLPIIGYDQPIGESFQVHSLLFLKTYQNQLFNSTYVLRAHLFINELDDLDQISFATFIKYIKSKI